MLVFLIQYHGGTNFGRNASAFILTSYYDQAPLDEYGMLRANIVQNLHILKSFLHLIYLFFLKNAGLIRQPKWGHLREMHAAVKLCSNTLLYGTKTNFSLGELQEVTFSRIPHEPEYS